MLRLAHKPAEPDDGITVAEAARIVGSDETTVRELVRNGQLEGWRVGKHRKGTPPTAIRISEASCYDYRRRNAIVPQHDDDAPVTKPRRRPSSTTAAHLEALTSLRARRFRV